MQFHDAASLARSLPFGRLIEGLRGLYAQNDAIDVPQRLVVSVSRGRELLIMPSVTDRLAGTKLLSIVPENAGKSQPVIQGAYVVFDFANGCPIGVLDAAELTSRRTAAVSALAADCLARRDASRLLVVGTGNLAPYFAEAMLAVRPFERIDIWGRNPDRAAAAARLIANRTGHVDVRVAQDLADSAKAADVISCVTSSAEPLIEGSWLSAGMHLDLVGGYRPDMREADDACFARASIYVDARDAVLAESGDLLHPINNGVIGKSDILGDITDLASGAGRSGDAQITVFKAVGTAAADLFAARIALHGG